MMVLGCMHALLLATANTELDGNGRTALQHGTAKAQGHTATASRNWPHAAPSLYDAPTSLFSVRAFVTSVFGSRFIWRTSEA